MAYIKKEQLDKFLLGIENIKKLIEDKDMKPPQGWLVYVMNDIEPSKLVTYLTKNGFKKCSTFKKINPKLRYFDLDEDRIFSQLSSEDFIEARKHVNLNENNLIFASELLGLESNLTLKDRNLLSKLK